MKARSARQIITIRTRTVAVASLAVAALALGGCAGSSDSGGGEGDDVTLQFWTWSLKEADPKAQAIIAQYEEENPGVTIQLAEVGGTADTSSKLLAADRADDTPDIVQVEYRAIPSLVTAGVIRDITDDVAENTQYVADNIWALSTLNGQVYGVPQDIGPMTMTYRADLFEQYGVEPPKTWADYAAAAQTIHEQDPSVYIGSFSSTEFEFFAAHASQAGAQWWATEDDAWTVGIDGEESLETADFWQDLVDRDLMSVEPLLTPEWNAKVNDGKLLSWTAAAWAPSVIHAVAPDTAGKWESIPLPQWTDGDASVPFLGGSAYLIPEKSAHAEQAAKFAAWLGASDEGSELLLTLDLYPAGNAGREATLANEPPALMPQQTDFWEVADEIVDNTTIPVTWGPNVNVAMGSFVDALSEAATSGGSFRDVYTEIQGVVVDDLTKTGYTVQ
jgi:multiple sugar transport system substrate-binding protein